MRIPQVYIPKNINFLNLVLELKNRLIKGKNKTVPKKDISNTGALIRDGNIIKMAKIIERGASKYI